MCDQCHLIGVVPEFAEEVENMIVVSGEYHSIAADVVMKQCAMFRITLSVYYLPQPVKRFLFGISELGAPILDWRDS